MSNVVSVTVTLEGDPLLSLQGPGPMPIDLASVGGKTLTRRLLQMLAQVKAVPASAVKGQVAAQYYYRRLSFKLKRGGELSLYLASPTAVGVNFHSGPPNSTYSGGLYETSALARWLATGWEAAAHATRWTCSSQTPPKGMYPNQIRGALAAHYVDEIQGVGGPAWAFVASAGGHCVTLYTWRNGAWVRSLVTAEAPSGSMVAQAQFVDPEHGFVLVNGASQHGRVPREIYGTADGGLTWRPLSNVPSLSMSDTPVAMRFTSPSDGWLTTVDNSFNPPRVYVVRTTNGGKNWTAEYFNLSGGVSSNGHFRYAFATLTYAHGLRDTIAVFGPYNGIAWFDSTDGGVVWTYDANGNG